MTTAKECSQYKIICNGKLYLVSGCICKNWFGRIATVGQAASSRVSENSSLTNNICWLDHKFLARRQQLFEKYIQVASNASADKKITAETFFLASPECSSSLASEQVRLGCHVFDIPH